MLHNHYASEFSSIKLGSMLICPAFRKFSILKQDLPTEFKVMLGWWVRHKSGTKVLYSFDCLSAYSHGNEHNA